MQRAAAGDWPVLVPGGRAVGYLTAPLGPEMRARLDWYELAFGLAPETVTVTGPEGPTTALVYREVDGPGGSGDAWSLTDWVADHGPRTFDAAKEIMRGLGRTTGGEITARCGVIQARAQGRVRAAASRRPETVGGGLDPQDIAVADIAHPYDGFQSVEEWTLDHPRFDGERSGPLHRVITQGTDAATVLPYDPVRDRVLLIEQLRIGALAHDDPQPWMLEPVAGLIDAGETPEAAAIRETREEAGLTVTQDALHPVARYYPSPGGLAQILHSYVALCDLPGEGAGLHGLADEAEDIRSHRVAFADLMAMVDSGEAANAPLILSAQWLALNRDRLRG